MAADPTIAPYAEVDDAELDEDESVVPEGSPGETEMEEIVPPPQRLPRDTRASRSRSHGRARQARSRSRRPQRNANEDSDDYSSRTFSPPKTEEERSEPPRECDQSPDFLAPDLCDYRENSEDSL